MPLSPCKTRAWSIVLLNDGMWSNNGPRLSKAWAQVPILPGTPYHPNKFERSRTLSLERFFAQSESISLSW